MNKSQVAHACPECRVFLSAMPLAAGSALACRACAGVCVNLAVLRQHAPQPIVRELWACARDARRLAARQCPSCQKALRTFELDDADPVELDACTKCMLLWFDGRELERVGVTLAPRSVESDAVRQAKALMDSQALHDNAKFTSAADAARILMRNIYWWYLYW